VVGRESPGTSLCRVRSSRHRSAAESRATQVRWVRANRATAAQANPEATGLEPGDESRSEVPKLHAGQGLRVGPWRKVEQDHRGAAALADRHYSRRESSVGSPRCLPPGQQILLVNAECSAVFGWWRPHPRTGIRPAHGLDGWTCSIFRNEGRELSSALILDAERWLDGYSCGPAGLLTWVWPGRLRSSNPGWCFQCAGWRRTDRRTVDGEKLLLSKLWPWGAAAQLELAI
jgi:hypothetical protein